MKKHAPKPIGAWQQYAPIAILVLFAASLLGKGTWIWFLSGLSHMPLAWSVALLVLAGALVWLLSRDYATWAFPVSPIAFDAMVIVVAAAAFVGLATQTHFFGDGYLLLSNLAQEQPLVKQRESVVMWLLVTLRNAFGSAGPTTALEAFRTLSILSGILSVVATLWLSRRIVTDESDRRFLCGLLVTGGAMLLFFGYVENYAVWHLLLTVFGLTGVWASKVRSLRWVPALVLLPALSIHPVSVLLVPPALYLLLPATLKSRLHRTRRRTLTLASVLVVGGLYAWTQSLAGDWYTIRFAFLPLFTDRFTVDGYTLLSPVHLLDFANLVLILAPGVLVLSLIARSPQTQEKGNQTFLHLYLLAALLLGFLLDPKLGMPRDWDLFAFVGPPVILWSWFCVIQPRLKIRAVRRLVATAIVIQAVVLMGRVFVSAWPEAGVRQAISHFEHAPGRSRTGWNALSLYYLQRGDSTSFRANQTQRDERYPEERLARASQRFMEQGDVVQARVNALQALRHNPRIYEAWYNLGRTFRHTGRFDSSLTCMQIADGLNPYSFVTLVELGMARLKVGDVDSAEKTWLKSLSIDSSHFIAYGALANLYAARGDTSSQVACLQAGLSKSDAESWAALALADIYVARAQLDELKQLLELAEDRGFDSSTVARLREKLAPSAVRES